MARFNSYVVLIVLFYIFLCSLPSSFSLDENGLADQIAQDLKEPTEKLSLKTVAFWRLISNDGIDLNITKFQDKLDVDLLNNGNCDVVDRSSFKRIAQEMKLSASVAVEPDTIKRIGNLYGVGGFIYAESYNDPSAGENPNYYLLVKLIDTETGVLLFGKSYRLDGKNYQTSFDNALEKITNNFLENIDSIKNKKIKRIAVWNVTNAENSKIYTEKITCALTETSMQISDRENLNKLLDEQKFASSELVDPRKAIEIGHIYGIDGFIYGNIDHYEGITHGENREYISDLTLKMIDTEKGILVWGDEGKGTSIAFDVKRANEQKKARQTWANYLGQGGLILGGATLIPIIYPEYFSSVNSRRTWMWSTAPAAAACLTTWLILTII